ncbi:hypothetical protein EMIT036CA2_50273 [Chryseobacterium sp. IT-36CA2]
MLVVKVLHFFRFMRKFCFVMINTSKFGDITNIKSKVLTIKIYNHGRKKFKRNLKIQQR